MTEKVLNLIIELKHILYLRSKGGQGSGGWGHDGRLGKHGGSKAGSAGLSKIGAKPGGMISRRRKLAKRVSDAKKPGIQSRKVRERLATVDRRVMARNKKKVTKLLVEKDVLGEKISAILGKQISTHMLVDSQKISGGREKRGCSYGAIQKTFCPAYRDK